MKDWLSLRCMMVCLVVVAAVMAGGGRGWAQDERDLDGPQMAGMSGSQMVRGTVSSAAGDRIAIKTDKGEAYQIAVTNNTRIMKDRQPFKLADLRPGDNVGAMGLLDAPTKTVHALFVMVVDAEQVKKARESLGKLYIAGKVTAIDELKLTILRPDNVTQVIAVDEGTSFKKGGRQLAAAVNGFGSMGNGAGGGVQPADGAGESITLADIKVGDTVAGKGEVKSGIFVPSQLSVMDASARQRRRRAEGGGTEQVATPQPR